MSHDANSLAQFPDLLLWLPQEICSPHQSFVWEHFLQEKKNYIKKKSRCEITKSEMPLQKLLLS